MQSSSIEGFFIELNLRCKKWLLNCSYNSHRSLISEHLRIIGKDLDLETGLSDIHKMIVTILKTHFQKKEPKIIQYQDYKNFSEVEYREFLVNLVSDHDQCPSYHVFLRKCKIALGSRAPLKYKYLRSNHSPFMNKGISIAIMDRTRSIH